MADSTDPSHAAQARTELPHRWAGRQFLDRTGVFRQIDGAMAYDGAEAPVAGAPPAGYYGARPFLPALDPTPFSQLAQAEAATMWSTFLARLQAGQALWEGNRLIRETRAARYASLGSKDELAAVSADTT